MRFAGRKVQLHLHPEINSPFIHMPFAAQLFQCSVGFDTLYAQCLVGKGTLWLAFNMISGYIGITFRPAGADIKVTALLCGLVPIYVACRSEECRRAAVRTGMLLFLDGLVSFHKFITSFRTQRYIQRLSSGQSWFSIPRESCFTEHSLEEAVCHSMYRLYTFSKVLRVRMPRHSSSYTVSPVTVWKYFTGMSRSLPSSPAVRRYPSHGWVYP